MTPRKSPHRRSTPTRRRSSAPRPRFWRTLSAILVALFAISTAAQTQAPNDVQLSVSTQDSRTHFHLGEEIRLQFRYLASIQGKYLLTGPGLKAKNWEAEKLHCTPNDGIFDRQIDDGRVSAFTFFHQGCDGVGGGAGGGCADCSILASLGPRPAAKEMLVNQIVQFTRAGTYTCTATDGSIVQAASAPNYRVLRLTSNPITLTITDDSAWSAEALKDALDQLAAEKCAPLNDDRYRCVELAERLRYLDTPDSLAASAQLLAGRNKLAPWQQQLWLGLFQSAHQDDVIRLLEMRFTDPDFGVTVQNMEDLTGIRLRKAFPQAFAKTAKPEDYRTPAIFLLQETIRELGHSLPDKDSQAKAISARTYEDLAKQSFCQSETIIPDAERTRVLKQAFVAARPTAK